MTNQLSKKEIRLFKLVEAGGTDKELAVMEEITELEEKLDRVIYELKAEFKERVEEIKANVPNLDDVLSSIKGQKGDEGYTPQKGKDYFTEKEKNELVKEVLSKIKIPKPKDGYTPVAGKDYPNESQIKKIINETIILLKPRDGKDADEKMIINSVLQKLSEMELESDSPEEIRNKLELLRGDERLDKSAIKGIDEALEEIAKKAKGVKPFYVGSSGGGAPTSVAPTGAINGSNTAFTVPSSSFHLYYVNGQLQSQTNSDYTLSGTDLTTGRALAVGESHIFVYWT